MPLHLPPEADAKTWLKFCACRAIMNKVFLAKCDLTRAVLWGTFRMKNSLPYIMTLFAISIFGLTAFGQKPASTAIAGIQKGDSFSDLNIPPSGRVSDVFVFAEDSICAVQLQFVLSDGRSWLSPQRGSSGMVQVG